MAVKIHVVFVGCYQSFYATNSAALPLHRRF